MSHHKSFIIFADMAAFTVWNDAASTAMGSNYSIPIPRVTPADGTVASVVLNSNMPNLWDGPTKTYDEVMALGYFPVIPPPPE